MTLLIQEGYYHVNIDNNNVPVVKGSKLYGLIKDLRSFITEKSTLIFLALFVPFVIDYHLLLALFVPFVLPIF